MISFYERPYYIAPRARMASLCMQKAPRTEKYTKLKGKPQNNVYKTYRAQTKC